MAKETPKKEVDPQEEAVEAYEYAQKRSLEVRKEWEDYGKPYTITLHNGVETAHPLWKVMMEAESAASRLRERVKPKQPAGRPVGATSAPDRQRPAPLRAVK